MEPEFKILYGNSNGFIYVKSCLGSNTYYYWSCESVLIHYIYRSGITYFELRKFDRRYTSKGTAAITQILKTIALYVIFDSSRHDEIIDSYLEDHDQTVIS